MATPSSTHRDRTSVVAHRAETMPHLHAAAARIEIARQSAAAWLAEPMEATRRAHVLIAAAYAFVAVDAGLVVVLIGAHR